MMSIYCVHLYNCGNASSLVSLYDTQLKGGLKNIF